MKNVSLTILATLFICFHTFAFEWESEHPALAENTKKAIAEYKRHPSEENRAKLLKVMHENYDAIIQLKKDNLAERVRDREQNINRWMRAIRSGDVPPFMKLNTENHKGNERRAVADAVEAYRKNPSRQSENAVRESLNVYYDAFLDEQEKHVKDTEEAREMRMRTSLTRFTSDRFLPNPRTVQTSVGQEDTLAEIVCWYISVGAEIVPVNPEARVRERGFNLAINTAQTNYLKDSTAENRAKLRDEIVKAFQVTYDVRLEEFAKAEKKGIAGVRALFAQMQNADFRNRQFLDLTQQRNLYGRIDRMITYGSNTVENWEPHMKTESQELSRLLQEYERSHTTQREQAVEAKLNAIYSKMLIVHKEHLQETKGKLDSFTEQTLKELAD